MNAMKKILLLGTVITTLLFVVCCGKDDNPSPPPVVIPTTITLTPQSAIISALGGAQTLTVTANADWTVNSNASWLTATKLNATSLKIEAGMNTYTSRNTTVRCSAGTVTATLNVSQAQITAMQSDSLALVDLYNATAGSASWTRKWTLTTPVHQWSGVTVTANRVTELRLSANKLTGALPESFGNLTVLRHCDFSNNNLSGAVPASINRLTQLEYLDLSENTTMNGTFPTINALTKLSVFDISFNSFTALPALNTLTALKYLAFSKNKFSGSLPDNFSALTNLIYLDASFNNFSGNIPSTWSSLSKMKVLFLYKNSLSGSIPTYIVTSFTVLEALALDGNNLSGNIPTNLGSLSTLNDLWLAQNRLTGEIPNSLLSNSHWAAWKNDVCPQQSGYGFSNCTGSPAPTSTMNVKRSAVLEKAKEKYKAALQ